MSSFLKKIQQVIADADSVDDLVGIMQHIPLESVKKFLNGSLKSMNENNMRTIYYESASINDIFSNDVIQSVLSNVPHQKSTKCVSKSFKKASKDNEIFRKRSREKIISSQFNGKNEWHLNENELQKNDELEPYSNVDSLDGVFHLMEDGDKLYIDEGAYGIANDLSFCSKAIQIEGIGNCTINVNMALFKTRIAININSKMSIKNVTFEKTHFDVRGNAHLYLTDCAFTWSSGAIAHEDSKLDCLGCHFGGDEAQECGSAIYANGPCELSVIDCVFDACGGFDNDPAINLHQKSDGIQLKLIDNVFRNVIISPIGTDGSYRCKVNKKAVIKNNKVNRNASDVLYAFLG